MPHADLHVHSKHSLDGDEWFLKQIGARESYTEVEDLYTMAKMRGMDFVTLTDHNTLDGALELVKHHPLDAFTGVEVTVLFPENGCKIHVLVYGIDAAQFLKIQELRKNIYAFRDYLRAENIAYSVAHATFAVNGKLSMEILEKLILLFDIFEGINGCRSLTHNVTWTKALQSLSIQDVNRLYVKHKIEPFTSDPWIKGFTGGSDDHAGAFIGRTFTYSSFKTKEEFLKSLKDKHTYAAGRNSNFKTMAFIFSKIANDIAHNGDFKKPDLISNIFREMVLKNKPADFKTKLTAWMLKKSRDAKRRAAGRFLHDLHRGLDEKRGHTLDDKIARAYESIASLYDDLLRIAGEELSRDLASGNVVRLIRNFLNTAPAALLGAPFFTTLKLLHQNRHLIDELKEKYIREPEPSDKAVLWFSDSVRSLKDLPGLLKKTEYYKRGERPLQVIVSLPEEEADKTSLGEMVNLPPVGEFSPSILKDLTLRFPSFLKSLSTIQKLNPSQIVIDTPGPLGILGFIAAKLLGVPCLGFTSSDFAHFIERVIDHEKIEPDVIRLLQSGAKWFCSKLDGKISRRFRSSIRVQNQKPVSGEIPAVNIVASLKV